MVPLAPKVLKHCVQTRQRLAGLGGINEVVKQMAIIKSVEESIASSNNNSIGIKVKQLVTLDISCLLYIWSIQMRNFLFHFVDVMLREYLKEKWGFALRTSFQIRCLHNFAGIVKTSPNSENHTFKDGVASHNKEIIFLSTYCGLSSNCYTETKRSLNESGSVVSEEVHYEVKMGDDNMLEIIFSRKPNGFCDTRFKENNSFFNKTNRFLTVTKVQKTTSSAINMAFSENPTNTLSSDLAHDVKVDEEKMKYDMTDLVNNHFGNCIINSNDAAGAASSTAATTSSTSKSTAFAGIKICRRRYDPSDIVSIHQSRLRIDNDKDKDSFQFYKVLTTKVKTLNPKLIGMDNDEFHNLYDVIFDEDPEISNKSKNEAAELLIFAIRRSIANQIKPNLAIRPPFDCSHLIQSIPIRQVPFPSSSSLLLVDIAEVELDASFMVNLNPKQCHGPKKFVPEERDGKYIMKFTERCQKLASLGPAGFTQVSCADCRLPLFTRYRCCGIVEKEKYCTGKPCYTLPISKINRNALKPDYCHECISDGEAKIKELGFVPKPFSFKDTSTNDDSTINSALFVYWRFHYLNGSNSTVEGVKNSKFGIPSHTRTRTHGKN